MTVAFTILFTALILWWLAAKEFATVYGLMLSAGAMRRNLFLLMVALLPALAMLLPSVDSMAAAIIPDSATMGVGGVALMLLALFASVILLDKFALQPSVCLAFLGVMGAARLSEGDAEGVNYGLWLSQLVAPVVALVLAAVFSLIYRVVVVRRHIHLVRLAGYMRIVVIAAVAVLAVAVGMNNGALLVLLGKLLGGGSGVLGLLLPSAVFLIFSLLTISWVGRLVDVSAESYSDISSHVIASVGYAVAIVLILFSLPIVGRVGLVATPLSIPLLVCGALAGVSLVCRSPIVDKVAMGRTVLGLVATPLVSALLYHLLKNLTVGGHAEAEEQVNITILMSVLMFVMLIVFARYVRKQERLRDSSRRLIVTQQQQLYENQKALNALEMKTILAENDSLHSTLELKRKEIVNVALGISEQKEFLEKLAEKVHRAAKSSGEEKDRLIAELEKELNQRTSFSGEIDEFYTQAEMLHQDFSVKLTEEFPNLTTSERRLATLLRLGFSSKYIATLMNISPKSVEISRYRLRQKLGLQKGDNLINFIKSI